MYSEKRNQSQFTRYLPLLYRYPDAKAMVRGSEEYPMLNGQVNFYQTENGVLMVADVTGLPSQTSKADRFFGFHIHEGMECAGTAENPFADAGMHFNPTNTEHPHHEGDLSPLLGNRNGDAFSVFLTDAFHLNDVIDRTVIIHQNPDDFTTQPSGNSGPMIACGKILRY